MKNGVSVWSVVDPLTLDFNIEVPIEKSRPPESTKSPKSQDNSLRTRAGVKLEVQRLIGSEKLDIEQVALRLRVSPSTVRRVCRTKKIGNYSSVKGAIVSRSSQSPFGWDVVQGQLQHNSMEWSWVQKIHDLRSSGTSLHKIADLLTTQNVSTKNGGRWFAKTVSQILNFNSPYLINQSIKRRKHGTQ